jgi:hypothetical protein
MITKVWPVPHGSSEIDTLALPTLPALASSSNRRPVSTNRTVVTSWIVQGPTPTV